ncbi:MAG: transcription-repair coupling factor [Bacteroidales bacterium]
MRDGVLSNDDRWLSAGSTIAALSLYTELLTTSSSLTLRALLKTAVARTRMSASDGKITGLTPSAKALAVAAAASADRTLVLVVPTDADVEQMTSDVRFFVSALEGLSDAEADRQVLPFVSHEVDPYRGMSPHMRVSSARARALYAAATGTARVIVASVVGLLPRVSAPERLLAASSQLKPGSEIDPQALAALLADAGFTREDPVDQHGEFCVRGGVVDLFPAAEAQPLRLEFIGDTVESIRRYDPATQRSVATLDQLAVVPLRDVFDREPSAAHARMASRPADTQPDEEDLPPFEPVPGAPASEALELDRSATLFDYVSRLRGLHVAVSEYEEVVRQAQRFVEQIEASYGDAVGRAERPGRGAINVPSGPIAPPAELFVRWDDIQAMLELGVRLDELAVEVDPGDATSNVPATHVSCQPAVVFHGRLPDWTADIRQARQRGDTVLFVAATAGRAERTVELLKDYDLNGVAVEHAESMLGAAVLVAIGELSRGFRLPGAALQIYAETDVFEEERRAPERRRSAARAFLSDLRDLKVGDLVVHVDHGIGVFVGLKQIGVGPLGDAVQEFLELRYAADDKLFVPVERLDLVQKYTGASRPPLDRLGGASWERTKTRVRKAMRDMAEELLKLYAARKAITGHAFAPDTHWQEEFDGAFEYELTPDQQAAITDIKRDMETPTPMDRLLCGDVGYGKTEVAMRAAFKSVMDGRQVAFLAPTTVLAFQHVKTLTERFAGFPVRIDMVSRFRTKPEQKQILADVAAGKVDVIVGTHRLLSKDVQFRDLGLLVVDEEQRFGVAHKERIKQLRRKVDVLTMTATPIPRTLNMSLIGIRDMSIIETPPKDRLSIQTNVVKFDPQVIARAVRNELARGGQVYLVHNRVESIYSIGNLITRLVPEARIVVAHGQMSEDQLERAMVDFVGHKFDVLVATTIIENGLDIPNVNTIVINRADRYGLAQLYQLRGRVGRSDRAAYAYLLIPPETTLSPVARKRLAAIKEFSDLGSGFRVAALDLEIRGAGNLLGGEQSGHIEAIGFEMYTKLLEQTVRELKGEEIEDEMRATVNLGVDFRIDDDYVPDMNQRLMLYRRVASSRSFDEIDRILEEVRDRYGPLPDSVLNLAEYGRIRVMADRLGLESVDRQGPAVVLKFRPPVGGRVETRGVDPHQLVRFLGNRPDVTLAPPGLLKLELKPRRAPQAQGGGRAQSSGSRPVPARPQFGGGEGSRPSALDPRPRGGSLEPSLVRRVPPTPAPVDVRASSLAKRGLTPPKGRESTRTASWWTARARETEVKPGFTKEEILRPVREDPRGPDGVLTRVGELLSRLVELG